jgi:hypothetical protein
MRKSRGHRGFGRLVTRQLSIAQVFASGSVSTGPPGSLLLLLPNTRHFSGQFDGGGLDGVAVSCEPVYYVTFSIRLPGWPAWRVWSPVPAYLKMSPAD